MLSQQQQQMERHMLLGVSSLFEMHPPSIHVDLVTAFVLRNVVAQPGYKKIPIPILKPVSVSEIFNIHSFDEFLIPLEALSALVFKVSGSYSAVSRSDWLNKITIFPLVLY